MMNTNMIAQGDLLPALRGTVVRINTGLGGPQMGAPIMVTVTEWDSGKVATFLLSEDQFAALEVWE